MALGDNIRKLREEHELTQQQLADKLYVSRQTVCRWENGSRCPDLITAKKLALELEVSMDELISEEEIEENNAKRSLRKAVNIKERERFLILQEKILDILQIVGSVFCAVTLLFRVQLDMDVPVWLTLTGGAVALTAIIFHVMVSRKLRKL